MRFGCELPAAKTQCRIVFLPIKHNYRSTSTSAAVLAQGAMPKRAREGVWAVEVSESDDSAAMEEAVAAAPLAAAGGSGGGGGGAAVRCPFQACMRCAWGVPPEHHKNPVFIYDTYKRKMKSLEDETELTALEKCEQSQLVNWQLMAMERNLFDDGDIKENDALMPLTFLRNDASSAGVGILVS